MNINNTNLNKIINNIYKVFSTKCMGRYTDSDWHNVFDCIHLIDYIDGIEDINISAGKYYNYLDNDNDKIPYRDYELNITTTYGYITGYVRCCSAGTKEDPFSYYDLVISVWNDEEKNKLNESFDNKLEEFKKQLNNVKTFQDLKNLVITYCKKGVLVGSLLTCALCTFNLEQKESQELLRNAYITQCNVNNAENIVDDEILPKWEKVCDDVEATIYHATKKQCNSQPNITASLFQLDMNNPQGHKIIAMERTMMSKYGLSYGDIVKINGTNGLDGIYQIQDTMNKRFKGKNKIDILVNKNIHGGKWKNVSLYKLINYAECKDIIKAEMNDAINQSTIDKRQKYIFEASLNFNIDNDEDINLSTKNIMKSYDDVTFAETTILGAYNYLKSIASKTLCQEGEIFNVVDVYSHKDILKGTTDYLYALITIDNPKNRFDNQYALIVHKYLEKIYFGPISGYADRKVLAINKGDIDFITNSNYKIIYAAFYNKTRSAKKLISDNIITFANIHNLKFYFSKWNNESYYLPTTLAAFQKEASKFSISDNFVDNIDFIDTTNDNTNRQHIQLYIEMFSSYQKFLEFAKKLISYKYSVIDEFNNIYNQENIDVKLNNSSNDEITKYKNIQQEKIDNNKQYIKNLFNNEFINEFEYAIQHNNNAFYVSEFGYSKNRKLYSKLNNDVFKLLFESNNINIEQLINNSMDVYYKDFYNLVNKYNEFINKFDNNIDAYVLKVGVGKFIIDQAGDIFNYNFISTKLLEEIKDILKNNITDKFHIVKIFFTIESIYGAYAINQSMINGTYDPHSQLVVSCIDDIDNLMRSAQNEAHVIQRFYYKLAEKIYNDNRNGWNKSYRNKPAADIISNLRYNAGKFGSTPYNIKNINFAISNLDDLYYFLYYIAYAMINAFKSCNSFTPIAENINNLQKCNDEPYMDNINFYHLVKCLETYMHNLYTEIK